MIGIGASACQQAIGNRLSMPEIVEDKRRDYGERRFVAIGLADQIHITLVFTDRAELPYNFWDEPTHVFPTAKKAISLRVDTGQMAT
jgi:uncharacterized DUF497 family protein